jgi:hypothetical protein
MPAGRYNNVAVAELKKRAAALLSTATMSQREVAQAIGVSANTIGVWVSEASFQAMVEALAKDRTDTLLEALQKATTIAAYRLIAHIIATNQQGQPLWDVQWKAIQLALQMNGQPGVPVARSENKKLSLSGDFNKTLQQALAEPRVQKLLGLAVPLPKGNAKYDDFGELDPGAVPADTSGSGASEAGPDPVQAVGE